MKKLTMNRLAFSGIRANKKDYLLLGISAFLAIFAAVSTVLGTLALMQAATDRRNGAYGSEDAFVFDVQSVPENIPGVRQYGCVTVLGQVKDFPVGYYDEAAQRILNRRCMEGRLPEKAGEAAVDLTALERLQPGETVWSSPSRPRAKPKPDNTASWAFCSPSLQMTPGRTFCRRFRIPALPCRKFWCHPRRAAVR